MVTSAPTSPQMSPSRWTKPSSTPRSRNSTGQPRPASTTSTSTASIGESADLSAINNANTLVSLVIDGNGGTLDGGSHYQGFFVYAGDVTIENLTIANAAAIGGAGGADGGGGGAGLGGGLFVAGTNIVGATTVTTAARSRSTR